MWQSLKFNFVKSCSIDEELLERREVAHRDLILKELHSFAKVASCNIQSSICRILSKDGLVRISTCRGRDKYV